MLTSVFCRLSSNSSVIIDMLFLVCIWPLRNPRRLTMCCCLAVIIVGADPDAPAKE